MGTILSRLRTRAGRHSEAGTIRIVVIAVSGASSSFILTGVTPFAAFAAFAAFKLGDIDAAIVMGSVWVTDQIIGYGVRGYPITLDSVAWSAAVGMAAGLALFAARALKTTRPAPLMISLPFTAAFTTFELGLYAAALVFGGSESPFSATVIRQVFVANAITLCGLFLAYPVAGPAGQLSVQTGSSRLAGASPVVR